MSRIRIIAVVVCSFALIIGSVSAQQPAPSPNSEQSHQRDPNALALLNQCLAAAGGLPALEALQDFSGSGSITYFWAGEEVQGSVTVRGRGATQFRFDAMLSTGTRSWAVSDGEGSLKEADGTTQTIPYHNAVNLGSLTLPYPALVAALRDASMSVTDLGLVSVEGRQARQIRILKHIPSTNAAAISLGKLAARDFFVDLASFQIVKIQDLAHPLYTHLESYPHEISFADYRAVNGVIVPFAISERINGQQTWTVQLTDISFNSSLTERDFQL